MLPKGTQIFSWSLYNNENVTHNETYFEQIFILKYWIRQYNSILDV